MCARVTRRELLERAGKAAGVLAGATVGAETIGSAVGTSRGVAFRVDGDTFHADGETFLSAWTHEQVGHARALEELLDHDIATVMEFDHWNCRRLRGVGDHPGGYADIVEAGYAPHVVWNGPHSVESTEPWPVGSLPASVYQEGGARFGQFCADVAAGRLDGKLRAMGRQFAAVDAPVLFCPWEEANGDWRPAIGTRQNGPATWAAAWRHMVRVFRSVGATNVAWVLAPSGNVMRDQPVGAANGLDAWYPGDEYVDYVATDFYDHGGAFHSYGTPEGIVDELLGQFNRVTDERKPYIQNEIGVHAAERDAATYPSAAEWTERALRALHEREQVVGVCWWDMVEEGLDVTGQRWDVEPHRLSPSGEALQSVIDERSFAGSLSPGPATTDDGSFVDDCDSLLHLHGSTATTFLTADTDDPDADRHAEGRCLASGGRIARAGTTDAVDLVYAPDGSIVGFEVVFHGHIHAGGTVSFAVSTDGGGSWRSLDTITSTARPEGRRWVRTVYDCAVVPTGADRLLVRLAGGTEPWSGQVGHVEIETATGPLR